MMTGLTVISEDLIVDISHIKWVGVSGDCKAGIVFFKDGERIRISREDMAVIAALLSGRGCKFGDRDPCQHPECTPITYTS